MIKAIQAEAATYEKKKKSQSPVCCTLGECYVIPLGRLEGIGNGLKKEKAAKVGRKNHYVDIHYSGK